MDTETLLTDKSKAEIARAVASSLAGQLTRSPFKIEGGYGQFGQSFGAVIHSLPRFFLRKKTLLLVVDVYGTSGSATLNVHLFRPEDKEAVAALLEPMSEKLERQYGVTFRPKVVVSVRK